MVIYVLVHRVFVVVSIVDAILCRFMPVSIGQSSGGIQSSFLCGCRFRSL